VITYAWRDKYGLAVAQTALDGTLIRAPRHVNDFARVAPLLPSQPLQIVWNGTEYVVGWFEYHDSTATQEIRGLRYDAQLNQIDSTPFTVSEIPPTGEDPMLIAALGSVTIAYGRVVDGVQRIVTRRLDGLGPEPRRRAAR
jgi:hypothetical protein